MLFTASTVKDSAAGLKTFVERNLANGVDHMFLFVDDAAPKITAELNKHPHVTAIATGRGLVARQAAAPAQRQAADQRQRGQGNAGAVPVGRVAVSHRR